MPLVLPPMQYGWPEDIWFHVDNLSSPHVYVRMPAVGGGRCGVGFAALQGHACGRCRLGCRTRTHAMQGKCTMDDLTEDAIRDASQWCKQGSIEGCKKSSVVIIYTPWSNLRKEAHMAVRASGCGAGRRGPGRQQRSTAQRLRGAVRAP